MFSPQIIGGCVAVVLFFASLFGAYHHGETVSKAADGIKLQLLEKASADQHAADVQAAADLAQKHAQDLSAIDVKYQGVLNDEKTNHDRVIADMRNGTIRLRKQFAAVVQQGKSGSVAASASGNNAAASAGLSEQDAEFLVSESSRADSIVKQLTACQAVAVSDREIISKVSIPK